MATRTSYRRRQGAAYGYGGNAWLRSWFGGEQSVANPPANSNAGGNGTAAVPAAAAGAPYTPLQGIIAMGGSVIGRSPDGATIYVDVQGNRYAFDARTGQATGAPVPSGAGTVRPAAGTPAAGAAGGGAAGGAAAGGAAGGAAAGGGAPSSRVGTVVSATLADGTTVQGTITGEDGQTTTVRWSDGTVAVYNAQGQLVNSTPPTGGGAAAQPGAGAAGGNGAAGTPTGGDVSTPGTDAGAVTPAQPPYDPYASPNDPAYSSQTGPTGTIPAPVDQPPAAPAPTPVDPTNPYSSAYAAPAAPAPAAANQVVAPAPAPTPNDPTNPYSSSYTPPAAPAPIAAPTPAQPQMISTIWGWMTVDQLEALMGASTALTPAPMMPPPPPSPAAPAPAPIYTPPPSASGSGSYFDAGATYTPPPPPASTYNPTGPSLTE